MRELEPSQTDGAVAGDGVRPGAARRFGRAFLRAFRVYSRIFPFLFFGLFVPLQLARTDIERDTIAYYGAKLRAEQNESLYTPYPPNRAHDPKDGYPYYLYPPPLAGALSLLPDMGHTAFARVLFLLGVAGFWATAAGLSKLATGRASVDGTLIAGAALFLWSDVNETMQRVNVDLLLWPAATWAIASSRLRGALLAAIAAVKTFGAWPLASWTARRPAPALRSAAVAVAVIAGLSIATLGPGRLVASSVEWARHVAPALAQGQFVSGVGTVELPGGAVREAKGLLPENLSITFAPVQVAAKLGYVDPDRTLPTGIRTYLLLMSIVPPLLVAWLSRDTDPALQAALVLAAAVLFGPIVRGAYLPYLLPAGVLLWRRRSARSGTAPVPAARQPEPVPG